MNVVTQIERRIAKEFASKLRRISHRPKLSSPVLSSSSLSSLTSSRNFQTTIPKSEKETVKITFVDSMEKEYTVDAEVGKSFLDVAHDNNVELEGACGGELACATCHLIYSQEVYDTLSEKEPEEDDMLDLAFELTDT